MPQTKWEWSKSPFSDQLDPTHYLESPTHVEALARLRYLVENGRRLGLLVGPRGSGKSLLLKLFSQDLRRHGVRVVRVNLLGLQERDFFWTVAAQLGTNPSVDASRFHLWQAIGDRLAEHRYQRMGTVMLLDDADEAKEEVLTQIVRLLQFDASPEAQLTAIVSANVDAMQRLGPRLLNLCELRIELETWQPAETAAFVNARLTETNATPKFDASATQRLHELGRGNLRKVNQLAHLALLVGRGETLSSIDEQTVQSVYHELSVGSYDQ